MRKCWVLDAGGRWTLNHSVGSDGARITRCGVKIPIVYFNRHLDDTSNDDCTKCFPDTKTLAYVFTHDDPTKPGDQKNP